MVPAKARSDRARCPCHILEAVPEAVGVLQGAAESAGQTSVGAVVAEALGVDVQVRRSKAGRSATVIMSCRLESLKPSAGLADRHDAGRALWIGEQHSPAAFRRDQHFDHPAVHGKAERLRRLRVRLLKALEDLMAVATQLRGSLGWLAHRAPQRRAQRRESGQHRSPVSQVRRAAIGVALVSSDIVRSTS